MSTTPPVARTDVLANSHDLSSRGQRVETGTRTQNIQTGGVSVSNNNNYHPGSHHSNPIFYGNEDGSPVIVYYSDGPMPDPARLQRPYQSQSRLSQYRSGESGARQHWQGLPPPPPPYQAQAPAYSASPQASYSRSDSTNSNGVPVRAWRGDTHLSMLSQSPGLRPEHFGDVTGERALPQQSTGEGTTTESGSDREVGIVLVPEVASGRTPHAVTSTPVPTPAPARAPAPIPPLSAAVAGEDSSPPVRDEPQPEHQEHDDTTSLPPPAPSGTPSGSNHSRLAESSMASSENGKEQENGKRKKRASWTPGFFKGSSSKSSNLDPPGSGEGSEGASGNAEESKGKSRRGSFLGLGRSRMT